MKKFKIFSNLLQTIWVLNRPPCALHISLQSNVKEHTYNSFTSIDYNWLIKKEINSSEVYKLKSGKQKWLEVKGGLEFMEHF